MNSDAFFKITYGLYIVSASAEGKMSGHISNTVFQVTADPPRFAVCSNKDNFTTELINKSKSFVVSIIQENVDLKYIGNWGFKSGKEINKFENINYKTGKSGAPIILDKTIGFLECNVAEKIDVGTHFMFIGDILDADIFDNNQNPLTYAYYRNVIKGLSPKNSPTYMKKVDEVINTPINVENIEKNNEIFVCNVCGYEYDPMVGDPTSAIKPGTPFDKLPEDWECPICGTDKCQFRRL